MKNLRIGNDARVLELKIAEFLQKYEKVAFALKSAVVGISIAIMTPCIVLHYF